MARRRNPSWSSYLLPALVLGAGVLFWYRASLFPSAFSLSASGKGKAIVRALQHMRDTTGIKAQGLTVTAEPWQADGLKNAWLVTISAPGEWSKAYIVSGPLVTGVG